MTRKYTITDKVRQNQDYRTNWSKRMNIVRLREKENLSFREIGEIFGTTPQTIWEQYQKTKRQIQKINNKKAEYFKKYAKECELANQRMSGNQNKYGN